MLGNGSAAYAGDPMATTIQGAGTANTALTVGNNSASSAHGTLKLAAALGNNKTAENGINNK